jgi:hypothetical protein
MEYGKIPVSGATRERRYVFSVYLPQSVFNNLNGWACNMMTQWYGWNGNRMDWEVGRPPTIKFWQEKSDTYNFSHERAGAGSNNYPSPLATDEWEHWDVRIRWSNGADGYIETWKNGIKTLRYDGPTFYDTSVPESYLPRWDIGTYDCSWEGRLTDPSKGWTNYFDDIKIYVGAPAPDFAAPVNLSVTEEPCMPWTKRKKITIESDLVPSDQSNIPIPVIISSDSDIAAAAQADGDDIAFFASDGTTQLPYARISYSSGSLVARVKLGTILGATDTDFYIYYGDSGASNQEDRANTFSNGYTAYWAMDEDPSGSAPQMVDYTGNGHNGTANGSMTNTDEIAGKVGNGYAFDGTDDYMHVGTLGTFGSQIDTNIFHLSYWIRTTDTDSIITMGGGKAFPNTFLQPFINENGEGSVSAGRVGCYIRSEGSTTELLGSETDNTGITDGNWHKIDIVVNKDTDTITIYVDSVAQSTTYTRTESTGTSANFTEFAIGAALNGSGTAFGFGGPFDLDEVSIGIASRSADWVTTMYNAENNNGAFLTIGAEENLEGLLAGSLCLLGAGR